MMGGVVKRYVFALSIDDLYPQSNVMPTTRLFIPYVILYPCRFV